MPLQRNSHRKRGRRRRPASSVNITGSLLLERRLTISDLPLRWVLALLLPLILGASSSTAPPFLVVVVSSFPVGRVPRQQRALRTRERPPRALPLARSRARTPQVSIIDGETGATMPRLFVARSSSPPSTLSASSSLTDDIHGGKTIEKQQEKKEQQPKQGWDYRIEQLQAFRDANGHCLVTAHHEDEFPGLYQWTRTVRKRYRRQVKQIRGQRDDNFSPVTPNGNEQQQSNSSSSSSSSYYLSLEKRNLLQTLGFVWEPQEAAWRRRLAELRRFYAEFGHCRVPNNSLDYPLLGVWVRNQRREHSRLLAAAAAAAAAATAAPDHDTTNTITSSSSSNRKSTLTPARLRALEELDFEWYWSHRDRWQTRYEQLEEYYEQHGHSNVPQPQTRYDETGVRLSGKQHQGNDSDDEHSTATKIEQLGNWCMNQRTAYRNYLAGNPTALTPERIEKLEALDFQWNVRQYTWQRMLERLKDYHRSHGHTNVSVHDESNRDLRLWLIWQRYLYNSREVATSVENAAWKPSPLTEERIRALERSIPRFSWKARASAGPSSKDWAKLFDAMRDKGLQPGMRPKQHWFEGINPFSINVKSTYTEQDLLELWHQDADDDDEEDLDDDGMDGTVTGSDAWYSS